MAKHKKKKQDPADLLWLSMPAFFIGFYFTQSFVGAGIFSAIWFGGWLSFILYRTKLQEERLKRSGIYDLDKMDGRQFEHYLGKLFKFQGYKVDVTRAAGDYGADLLIEKENKRIVIQAKRYSKNVGIEAVQQAHTSIAYYKAHEAWVVSNRNFTEAATNLASSNNVRLVNREELINMMLQMNPEKKTS